MYWLRIESLVASLGFGRNSCEIMHHVVEQLQAAHVPDVKRAVSCKAFGHARTVACMRVWSTTSLHRLATYDGA